MDNPIVTTDTSICELLAVPLSPGWTSEGLAEQVLAAIAAQRSEDTREFILDADATTDGQSSRLLRPLLACLASKSADETGTPVNLFGGRLCSNGQDPMDQFGLSVHSRINLAWSMRRSDAPSCRRRIPNQRSYILRRSRTPIRATLLRRHRHPVSLTRCRAQIGGFVLSPHETMPHDHHLRPLLLARPFGSPPALIVPTRTEPVSNCTGW